MKKVYQTIVDKHKGNCMQAAVASLFEVSLEEIPNYIEIGRGWFSTMQETYKERGYSLCPFNPHRDIKLTKELLKIDGGINGYWYASVVSKFYGEDVTHAVIINKNMKVVHDPNPNNKTTKYSLKDIISIDMCKGNWHITIEGKIEIIDEKTIEVEDET